MISYPLGDNGKMLTNQEAKHFLVFSLPGE